MWGCDLNGSLGGSLGNQQIGMWSGGLRWTLGDQLAGVCGGEPCWNLGGLGAWWWAPSWLFLFVLLGEVREHNLASNLIIL